MISQAMLNVFMLIARYADCIYAEFFLYAKHHYAECAAIKILDMLIVFVLNATTISATMLSVIMLSVIIQSVAAPQKIASAEQNIFCKTFHS
jgi:hypothetical protein